MRKKLLQTAILLASGLALGGCPFEEAKTKAPVKKPPAPDYALASNVAPPPAARVKAICYNDTDLPVVRSRMLQQEMTVATLQCQTPTGERAFEALYTTFLSKFNAELSTNARTMQQMAGRKRFNFDVMITEFANRTAQFAQTDKDF